MLGKISYNKRVLFLLVLLISWCSLIHSIVLLSFSSMCYVCFTRTTVIMF